MGKMDLRLQYKRYTGDNPFFTEGNYLNEELRHPYFRWLEDKVLEQEEELKRLR